jgi:histone H2A
METTRKPTVTKSNRAGLKFPVGRLHRYLKRSFNGRVSGQASVFLAGAMEYLTHEMVELAVLKMKEQKKKRIDARHIFLAIADDEEFDTLRRQLGIVISGGGVLPIVVPSKSKKIKCINKKYKKPKIDKEETEKANEETEKANEETKTDKEETEKETEETKIDKEEPKKANEEPEPTV